LATFAFLNQFILALILCIETATEICSVCLAQDGVVVSSITDPGSNQHIEKLTLLIEEVLDGYAYSSLDAIAVSAGPGGYTSLRVGTSVAKGLCYSLQKPLIAINTLESLALASLRSYITTDPTQTVLALPMLDARRDEVCMQVFSHVGDKKMEIFQNFVSHKMFETLTQNTPQIDRNTVLILSGNGAKKCQNVPFLEKVVVSDVLECAAEYMVGIAEQKFQISDFQSVAYFEPYYMKAPSVTQQKKNTF
jgi:tRNA threonylcarbamoyladenosine biosynthesis protein TsaB